MLEAKWLFILLLLFFLGLTGYVMSRMDRESVMRNWTDRRCDLTVMLAARFFRPEGDPRTPSAFSSDNFDFCVQQFSESFLSTLMAPVSMLMGKQATMAGSAMSALNQVREVMNRVRDAFLSYIRSYTEKLTGSMKELRRVFLYLRMAVQRMVAIAMSTIYMGMTLFRGMLTSIQVVVRVILIICAIMIAVIIILWFVLLPVIPFILTTLTAVVALVGALSVVLSGSLATQAESQKGGFCFGGETKVEVEREGQVVVLSLKEVMVGDVLWGGHRVTMRMEVTGEGVKGYEVDGIYVSGDHRIQHPSGGWGFVHEDERAKPSASSTSLLYCFNTTTRCIPLKGISGTTYLFRDWEEFDEEDEVGHRQWQEAVLRQLHPNEPLDPQELESEQGMSWREETTRVCIPEGGESISLSRLQVGDRIMARGGGVQRVLGMVQCATDEPPTGYRWEKEKKRWVSWKGEAIQGGHKRGWSLITETGEWGTPDGEWYRDFTEVGHHVIRDLYNVVSGRLCSASASSII
jgi:hypothetical protein